MGKGSIFTNECFCGAIENSKKFFNTLVPVGESEVCVMTVKSNCNDFNDYTEFVTTLFYFGHPLCYHKHTLNGIESVHCVVDPTKLDKTMITRFDNLDK